MGNIVDLRPGAHPFLQMSNGLTSVFIEVLALALSDLAVDDRQRALAVAVAARDQNVLGQGCAAFSIVDLPWERDRLHKDIAFFHQAVKRASSPEVLARLEYEPSLERLTDALSKFSALLAGLLPEDASDSPTLSGLAAVDVFQRCPVHSVYLHAAGCVRKDAHPESSNEYGCPPLT